ncbi:alpha-amylase family glycosyl hydrolase [Haliovirga abyssi]|uniref:Alpha-amylase n=1 Tax=Haliovirga abyssi TaxID=2996794 RepID=A0AAU9DIK3_9FUSO|nr:alpha-amylase family glycosyl hydrolase [Haliovirga abyssi]BDU51427.1 alpha-amylase [Haliovirga abyssi]
MKRVLLALVVLVLAIYGCEKKDKVVVTKTATAKKSSTKKAIKTVKKDEVSKYLQVSSPSWKDQIIYFVMTDRFNDGDPTNNDQGAGEYDPTKNSHYSGGDIKGVTDKLDYIKDLGVTAVWITPPVANQWWDPWVNYSGYHGYWGENFKEVDKHLGTLDDYKELSATLHKNGMYLIQDIVPNHTGNFFRYKGKYNPNDLSENYEANLESKPTVKPTQFPFNLNDPRKEEDRKAGIYHFTPDITNFKDQKQIKSYQMSGLDDLNTENPVVRDALKDSYNYWIENVGVDAFRIDTVVYVEHDFWNDFIHSKSPEHLGVQEFAKKFKKDDFFTFGETWVNVDPYSPSGDEAASSYQGTDKKPEISSVLDFPLHITLQKVFGEGKATDTLTYRLGNSDKYYKRPYRLLNFIDNHDMNRLLTSAPYIAVKQSLMFIMTTPGIPVVYYGTEQQFTETRGSMFAEGFGSGGKDHFDENNDAYKFLQSIIKIRKENAVFRRGKLSVIKDTNTGAGIFSYKMEYKGKTGLVIFNTSENPMLLDNLKTGLAEGTKLKLLKGLSRADKDIVVGKDGKISKILAPRAGLLYMATDEKVEIGDNSESVSLIGVKNGMKLSNNYAISGKVNGAKKLLLVFDGAVKNGVKITANEDGSYTGEMPVESMSNGKHTVVAYAKTADRKKYILSETYKFIVDIPFVKAAEYNDKVGDDHGPTGNYKYPTAETFTNQMDIKKATIYTAGKNLKVSLEMAGDISTMWNPKYKFDHVSINIFISVPGQEGIEDLPFQNAKMPNGLKWNYMTLEGGWTNFIYSSRNASAKSWGSPVSPSPVINVIPEKKEMNFTISGSSIGNPKTLKGIKVYIATWDYDGLENSYRGITPEGKAYIFGGGDENSPKIMDDIPVLEIK